MQELSDDFSHQIGTYDQRLAAIKRTREAKASAIQGATTKMQSELLQKMTGTVDTVEAIGKYAQNAFNKMTAEQEDYDTKLARISGFEANHEEGLINTLMQKAARLETTQAELTGWQRMERHQTAAWRNEANRQLRNLQKSMDQEQAEIEGSQLDYELNSNKKRRGMEQYVGGLLRDASKEESAEITKLTEDAQNKMQGLMSSEQAQAEKEASDLKLAQSRVRQSEDEAETQVAQARNQAKEVEQKARLYHEKVNAAEEKLKTQFPQDGASEYQNQVRKLEKRLATLGSAGALPQALLQDVSAPQVFMRSRKSASALPQALLQEDAAAPQVLALRSLNAELKEENDSLRKEDEMLERRAKKIADALIERGISV
jgi:chromosome segregation ATPase